MAQRPVQWPNGGKRKPSKGAGLPRRRISKELLAPLLHRHPQHPHVTQAAATSFLAGAPLMHQRPQLPQAAATS
jgi:hypothetical protein